LESHFKTQHDTGDRRCCYCGYAASKQVELMAHIRCVHNKIRNVRALKDENRIKEEVDKTKEDDNIIQEVWKGTNQIDLRDDPEEKIHLTRPVHDKMIGNKKEAKVKHDCQDPTEHIKKKPKKTDLIHNDIAGKELDASLTELNHGDERDFHKMSAEEMPVFTPKSELPCDVSPKIVNIACMEGNSLRIIDGRGGFKERSAISEDVIKQEFEKCPELENVEMKTEQIDIKNEFVCND
jgi:hypothetical protein